MSLAENERDPPFRSDVRASGLGEVWTHSHDELKFTQFGWRSTTKESSYSNNTLIGNWNEEKFDINCQNKAKRLPSQYEHYFETTQGKSYNRQPIGVPPALKHLKAREPLSFPGHQPELDSPAFKAKHYNTWQTASMAAYTGHQDRTCCKEAKRPCQKAQDCCKNAEKNCIVNEQCCKKVEFSDDKDS